MAPAVILYGIQLAENLGAIARVMKNFGLSDLRLVAPRCAPQDPLAFAVACGADDILIKAQLFPDLPAAIADLTELYGTCGHERDLIKPVLTPRDAIMAIQTSPSVGILFGSEQSGLSKDQLSRCTSIISIPAEKDFSSLNIAQSVSIIGYEFFLEQHRPVSLLRMGNTNLATQKEIDHFLDDLEIHLDKVSYWRVIEKKPTMWRMVKSIFTRIPLTSQEIRTLYGLVQGLGGRISNKLF